MDKNFSESSSSTHARSLHDYYIGACTFFKWKITREHTNFHRISSPPNMVYGGTPYYSVRRTFLFFFVCRFHGPSFLTPFLLLAGSLEVQRHCRTATKHAWTCASRALSSAKLNSRMVVQRSQTLTMTLHTFVILSSTIIYASDFNDPKRCVIEITIKKNKNIYHITRRSGQKHDRNPLFIHKTSINRGCVNNSVDLRHFINVENDYMINNKV